MKAKAYLLYANLPHCSRYTRLSLHNCSAIPELLLFSFVHTKKEGSSLRYPLVHSTINWINISLPYQKKKLRLLLTDRRRDFSPGSLTWPTTALKPPRSRFRINFFSCFSCALSPRIRCVPVFFCSSSFQP